MNASPASAWSLQRLCRATLALALLVILGACGESAADPSIPLVEPPSAAGDEAQPPPRRTVALVMKTLTNPFFREMESGARRAEAELQVRLIVKTASQETSIDHQIAIVEDLIAERVDAIVVAPGDSTSLVPVLARAQAAGIVVVNVDNRLDAGRAAELGLVGVPFISVDNEDGAYRAARVLSQRITRPTRAVVLEGIRTALNASYRRQGALRAFEENSNIQVVALETAHWKIDEAYDVTRALFEANPDIGVIFCANDMMALGAIRYLTEAGRPDVLVAGFDALDEARQAIRDGTLLVSVDQQAAEQGYLGVQYAVRMLADEQVPQETLVPAIIVDQQSLAKSGGATR